MSRCSSDKFKETHPGDGMNSSAKIEMLLYYKIGQLRGTPDASAAAAAAAAPAPAAALLPCCPAAPASAGVVMYASILVPRSLHLSGRNRQTKIDLLALQMQVRCSDKSLSTANDETVDVHPTSKAATAAAAAPAVAAARPLLLLPLLPLPLMLPPRLLQSIVSSFWSISSRQRPLLPPRYGHHKSTSSIC